MSGLPTTFKHSWHPFLFQILSNPPPFPVAFNPHPHCSFCCLISLAERVISFDVLFYLLILWIYTLICFMQQGITKVWHMWFFVVLWFDITNTNTHMHTYTQHNQGLVDDTPTKMYIYTTCHALTAAIFITQNEYLTDIKNLLSTVSFLLKNYLLAKVIYLLIRCYKTRLFLWNTGNCINKQSTHTHQTLRER